MAAEIMRKTSCWERRLPGNRGWNWRLRPIRCDKLLAHLNQFIIMDDVELIPLGEEQVGEAGSETAIGLTGPLAAGGAGARGAAGDRDPMAGTSVEWNGWDVRILRGYGVLAPHYEFWLPSAGLAKLWSCLRTGGATPVGAAALEAFRIAEGIPAYGIDMVERDLPQETAQMRALHFSKGCYLGQEIVERIRSRGNVHRHLRPLELTGPAPESGDGIDAGGRDGCGNHYQRGGVAAEEWRARVCAGHDARGGGGEEPELPVQGRGHRGNGKHSGRAAEADCVAPRSDLVLKRHGLTPC